MVFSSNEGRQKGNPTLGRTVKLYVRLATSMLSLLLETAVRRETLYLMKYQNARNHKKYRCSNNFFLISVAFLFACLYCFMNPFSKRIFMNSGIQINCHLQYFLFNRCHANCKVSCPHHPVPCLISHA